MEERGLARAVGAEQTADLAGRDRERDVPQGKLVTEGLADAVDDGKSGGQRRRLLYRGGRVRKRALSIGLIVG